MINTIKKNNYLLVYLFILSIKLMGASFKIFGKEFAETLIATTSNPFVGLFIGVLATSLIQSSSPLIPSCAVKNNVVPTFVRYRGLELEKPG